MAKAITTGQLRGALDRIADYFLATNEDMVGASTSAAGAKGMVPAPSAGDNNKVLLGNGTWGNVPIAINHYVDVYNSTTGKYDLSVPAVSV